MPPLVSVVVPAFNCAPFISGALDSIFAQGDSHVEVIVVDDGSTDETPSVLARYSGRISILRQSNLGVASARNHGISAARGELLAFLDADDMWQFGKLKLQRLAVTRWPKASLVFTNFRLVDANGSCLALDGAKAYYRFFERHRLTWGDLFGESTSLSDGGADAQAYCGNCFPSLFLGNFIKTSTVLVHRRLLEHLGGFDVSLTTEEDYDFWLRVARHDAIACVDAPLVDVRRRPGQLTSAGNALAVASNVATVITRTAQRCGDTLGQGVISRRVSDVNRSVARAALAAGERRLAREALRRCVREKPIDVDLGGMLIWAMLPGAVSRAWRAVRRLRR